MELWGVYDGYEAGSDNQIEALGIKHSFYSLCVMCDVHFHVRYMLLLEDSNVIAILDGGDII